MTFTISIISILIVSGFVGTAFAQTLSVDKEFTEQEIEDMKHKAVLIKMNEGTLTIELYPEDAPATVYNFLKLVERGYYDGIVFHRIIPGFMVQAGDPNTKDPTVDQSLWGQGGPGYVIREEFNTLEHDRGIISMARSEHPDSAGSQFFIVHHDSHFLDAKYTAFGKLVPGTHSFKQLDNIANIATNVNDRPLDLTNAVILEAKILDNYSSPFGEPDRNESIVTRKDILHLTDKGVMAKSGEVDLYTNSIYDIAFHLPYRWSITTESATPLNIVLAPDSDEHNVQRQIEQSGFIPNILVGTEPRTDWEIENDEVNSGFFSIKGGDEPKILSNYIFEHNGKKAHTIITTQNVETEDGTQQFKVLQLHFNDPETNYSIIYVNTTEWFRYEVNAFTQVAYDFEITIDGKLQSLEFNRNAVFKQIIADAKAKPEPESLPPARIGGCLIATATYGSEMAPQVQLLREIRDNTILQTQSGTFFMNGFNHFYYSFSPTIADYERESPILKEAVKLTLTPLLASLTLLQHTDIDSEHEMLGYGIGLILLNIGMYFVAPAILITKIRSFYKLQ